MGWDAMYVTDADTAAKLLSHSDYYAENKSGVMNITDDTDRGSLPSMTTGFMVGGVGDDVYYINDFNALPVKISLRKGTYPNGGSGIIIGYSESGLMKLTIGSEYDAPYMQYDDDGNYVDSVDRSFTVCGVYNQDFSMNEWDNSFPVWSEVFRGYERYALMTEDVFNQIKTNPDFNSYVSVYVTFSDKHDVRNQAEQIANAFGIENGNWIVAYETLNYYYKENNTETTDYAMFKLIVLSLGALAGLAVIFIVRNSFNISVHERSHDYGVLRCIGLTRRQIIRIILTEAMITGMGGTLVGMVLGHGFCAVAFYVIGQNFTYLGGYHLSAQAVLWTIICMLIVTAYAMIAPVQLLYKLNPIESLRRIDEIESAEKNLKGKNHKKSEKALEAEKKKLERRSKKLTQKYAKKSEKITSRFGVEAGYAYKNLMRTKKRLAATIVTLGIGGGFFLGGSIYIKGLNNEILNEAIIEGDYSGYFECSDEDELNTIKKDLSALNCVEKEKATAVYFIYWDKKEGSDFNFRSKITVIGLEKEDYDYFLSLTDVAEASKKDNTYDVIQVLPEDVYDKENVVIGAFESKPQLNVVATVAQESYSTAMADRVTSLSYYYANEDRPLYLYCIGDDLGDVLGTANGELVSDCVLSTALQYNIKLNEKASDYYKFENYIDKTLHYYEDTGAFLKEIKNIVNIMKLVIYTVVILVLIIFFVNSINIQHAQMLLREGEFGVLRVIGMSRRQLRKMLMIEQLFGVSVATVLALVLGFLGGNLIVRGMYFIDYVVEDEITYPKLMMDWPAGAIIVVLMLFLGIIAANIGCRNKKDYI
jgi:ABC-type antimicrobial peptide transport system permease subunit